MRPTNSRPAAGPAQFSLAVIKALQAGRASGKFALAGKGLTEVPPHVWDCDVPLPAVQANDDAKWWEVSEPVRLDLSRNSLEFLPDELASLESLTAVDVSHNKLRQLDCVRALYQLASLNLANNQLTALPELPLSQLAVLNAQQNQLRGLPAGLTRCTALTNLNLEGNVLTGPLDGQALLGLRALQELNLALNQITHLPQEIGYLPKLRVLNITQNKVEALPPTIGGCSALVELHAGYNRLRVLPPELGSLRELRLLCVRDNQLQDIPVELCGLALSTLDLQCNDLRGLPPQLGLMTTLRSLLLDGNGLKTIRRELVTGPISKLLKYLQSRMPEAGADCGAPGGAGSSRPPPAARSGNVFGVDEAQLAAEAARKLAIANGVGAVASGAGSAFGGGASMQERGQVGGPFGGGFGSNATSSSGGGVGAAGAAAAPGYGGYGGGVGAGGSGGYQQQGAFGQAAAPAAARGGYDSGYQRSGSGRYSGNGSGSASFGSGSQSGPYPGAARGGGYGYQGGNQGSYPGGSAQSSTNNELVLNSGGLREVPPEVWQVAPHLTKLDLSNNVQLTALPQQAIALCTQLRTLLLNKLSLSQWPLPPGEGSLPFLMELQVKSNVGLRQLPPDALAACYRTLARLDLSGTPGAACLCAPGALMLAACNRLEHLAVSGVGLAAFPPDVLYLTELRTLDVSSNRIPQLPEAVARLAKLDELHVANNELTSLPPQLGLLKLRSLSLDGNPIKTIRRPILLRGTAAVLEYLRDRIPT